MIDALTWRFRTGHANPERIFADHPGDSPVHLSVRGARKTTVYALQAKVDATTITSDVKGMFGAEAWAGPA